MPDSSPHTSNSLHMVSPGAGELLAAGLGKPVGRTDAVLSLCALRLCSTGGAPFSEEAMLLRTCIAAARSVMSAGRSGAAARAALITAANLAPAGKSLWLLSVVVAEVLMFEVPVAGAAKVTTKNTLHFWTPLCWPSSAY